MFDFGNYSKDPKFFNETNKKVLGKMKDESEGKIIDEYVGLKSRMYSMKNIDGKESNTAKEWILQVSLVNLKTLYLKKGTQT